jgi:hypothetical protein
LRRRKGDKKEPHLLRLKVQQGQAGMKTGNTSAGFSGARPQ